jgi:hypothetical protein
MSLQSCYFLPDLEERLEVEKEGNEVIHILTKRGQKLGKLLSDISDFIVRELKWER